MLSTVIKMASISCTI